MNLRFLAFLLSVPALRGNDDWTVTYTSRNVCALRGSTVIINCTYKYPYKIRNIFTTVKTLWFIKEDSKQPVDLEHDADYTGRVEYSCGKKNCSWTSCNVMCTLRIKDLTQRDSAEYKFRLITNKPGGEYTGNPGVTLSVTDQVKVSFPSSTDPTLAHMQCHSMCSLAGGPTYTWFRNEQYVEQGMYYRGNISSEDKYSCAVEGYEHLHSPLVYAPKNPSVTVSPTGEIEEGSSVTLSCSSDANPAANYTWYKVNTDGSSREINQGQQLIFSHILSSDSGQYLCEAKNTLGGKSVSISVNVKYEPKNTCVLSSPSGEIEEGSSVTLSCSSDANPAANYIWFKEHEASVVESGQNYTITEITSELGGNYYCRAHNAIGCHNSTFLYIAVTSTSSSSTSSSQTTAVALGTFGVLLTTILILAVLWMRIKRASRKACGQGGRPETVEEPLPAPVYDNVSALTNGLAPAAQGEPIEQQDDLLYANIHTSHSESQEVARCLAGSRVQSEQTEVVLYSLVNAPSPNAVPKDPEPTEMGETSELYSTAN